jgi:tetratricopeptide (TPR) repeat protein
MDTASPTPTSMTNHAHSNGVSSLPVVPGAPTHDFSSLSVSSAQLATHLLHEAQLRRTRHQYAESIVAYERILDLLPNFIPAWTGKGVCYKAMKDHVSAVQCFQRALQLDPTDWSVTHDTGVGARARKEG